MDWQLALKVNFPVVWGGAAAAVWELLPPACVQFVLSVSFSQVFSYWPASELNQVLPIFNEKTKQALKAQ